MKKYLMLAAAVVFMFSCGKHNEKKSDKHEHATVAHNHSHDGHDHSSHKHEDKKSDAKSAAKSTEHKHDHSRDGHDHSTHKHEDKKGDAKSAAKSTEHKHDHSHDGHDHSTHKHEDKKSDAKSAAKSTEHKHDHSHDGHDHSSHSHDGHSHDAHNHDGHDHGNPDEIKFTKHQAHVAGLQTEIVSAGEFTAVIRTSGEISAAVGSEQIIVAKSSGVISFVKNVSAEGAELKANQKLATISSKSLATGDKLVQIKAEYEAAEQAYNRAKKLNEEKIVSAKEVERLKADYLSAKSRYDAVAKSSDKSGGVALTSPISGYLKSRLVEEGDFVAEGTPIAVVTQTRRLQLRAEVPEKYYAELRNVKGANFTTSYDDKLYKLSDMNGRLLSYGRTSTDGAFYVPVTFEFDNCGDVLPGAFVEIYLLTGGRHNVMTLPVSAVNEQQGLKFVFIKLDYECYKKQEVKTGLTNGERIEILSGLEVGQEVVTRGVTQVKLAASASVVPEGHSHSH